jgi:tetratricopeptide (TPR) repeat protein
MKRALAILVGTVMVCAVAYLSWLNPTAVEFRLTPTRTVQAPLAALIAFAFITGTLMILAAVMMQAGRRAIIAWRQGREQRRVERIDDWEARGEELVWAGDAQQGRALLHKAWHRRPTVPRPLLALAASYRDTGEIHRARDLLAKAAEQHHTNPDVLLALADAHHAAGDLAAGIEVLERLRALRPQAPRVLRALRDSYVEARRWHDAAAVQEALLAGMRDASHATGEREHLTVLRYQASVGISDPGARIRALETLADSRGESVPVLVSLGDALLAAGRQDEASVLWERVLRSTPRTVVVERLAAIATAPRHRDRLRTLLRKLRSDQVQADNLHLLTALLYLADGDTDQAARELDALQNPASAPPLLHRLWGDVHRRRGHLEQSVIAYARANDCSAPYRCRGCERTASQWVGYCPQCDRWDSYRSDVEIGVR